MIYVRDFEVNPNSDYIKATAGFEKLGAETGASAKSLIRMFGNRGNPQARNLSAVLGHLQERAGLKLRVTATRLARKSGPARTLASSARKAAVHHRTAA